MNGAAAPDVMQLSLAQRADFKLGKAVLRPSLRTVAGPGGQAVAEPRVMQVILALLDAQGTVLSRDDLLRICWDGRIVGDDAINRAIAEARRISATTEAGFQIETIPRVGYRLNTDNGAVPVPMAKLSALKVSRRAVFAAAAGTIGVAGLTAWILAERRQDAEVDSLLEQGAALYDEGTDDSIKQAIRLFRRANELTPERADAKGWLALSLFRMSSLASSPDSGALLAVREAAQGALALDPSEPNARAVLAVLRRGLGDWVALESELRATMAASPRHVASRAFLGRFLVAVGRCRASLDVNGELVALRPFSPQFNFSRALLLWILGREADAYRVIERAGELWPTHPFVWQARLTILAFTARPRVALGMLEDRKMQPLLTPQGAAMWRSALIAIESGSAADSARASTVVLEAATSSPGVSATGVMLLSWLGHVDSAYRLAEGLVLRRGELIDRPASSADRSRLYSGAGWRDTQWLFTPATRRLREDDRFTAFCDSLGYSDYWRQRGIWPDDIVRGSLKAE